MHRALQEWKRGGTSPSVNSSSLMASMYFSGALCRPSFSSFSIASCLGVAARVNAQSWPVDPRAAPPGQAYQELRGSRFLRTLQPWGCGTSRGTGNLARLWADGYAQYESPNGLSFTRQRKEEARQSLACICFVTASATSFSTSVGHRWRSSTLSQPKVQDSLTVKPPAPLPSMSNRAFWLASSTLARRFCHCRN